MLTSLMFTWLFSLTQKKHEELVSSPETEPMQWSRLTGQPRKYGYPGQFIHAVMAFESQRCRAKSNS